jgi:cytochrome c oxidase subunit 1/cytochrome c oxidase subunit I+III
MYVVGLLGMPRQVYTYPGNMGWTAYNLAETMGAYLTALGIAVLFANLVVSYFRGPPSGPDPWLGPTLEWATSSPPPEYNFPVIPTVSSAYANWDDDDRELDARKLAEGVMVLEQGHEHPVSTTVDGLFSEVVELPHSSAWPLILTVCLSVVFVMLVIGKFGVAGIFAVLCLLSLLGWHSREPQEA